MSRQTTSLAPPETMPQGSSNLVRRAKEDQARTRLRELIEQGLASGPGHRRTPLSNKELLAIALGEMD